MFGSGGQGADDRTTANSDSGSLFGGLDKDDNSKSGGGILGGLFGSNDSDKDRDRRDTDTYGTDEGSKASDSGTFDTGRNDTAANRDSTLFETGGTGLGADSSRGRSDDSRGLGTGADTNRNAGAFTSGNPDARSGSDTDEETLRLHEERLQVDKDRVQTGEVNVGKRVVEERQTIDVPVEREEIVIERRPVNEDSTAATRGGSGGISADAYQEGDSIHIPLTEERVEVSKTNVVSEEIVVGKRKVQDTETINETVRREEADIDEDANTNTDLNRDEKDRF
ncbi:DUF2382 domain-containing protein [Planomicrobium sp. CPCC 101110]|nr:DUF2382 domain-containing protein [Planomicrobium sp. CPCC 101110]